MTYYYKWNDLEKAWVVTNTHGKFSASFAELCHAVMWAQLMGGQLMIVAKEQPKRAEAVATEAKE